MSKKILSMVLALSMMLSLCGTAFAVPATAEGNTFTTSFLDGEQKENVFVINVLSEGNVSVDHYVEGAFIGTATASTTDGYIVSGIYSDAKMRSQKGYTLDFTPNDYTDTTSAQNPSIAPRAYSLAGTITYKPYYDYNGILHNDRLNIDLQSGTEYRENRTFTVAAGYAAAIAISAVAAVLTIFCPALAAIASNVVSAIVMAAGTTIVGGVIQGAISKTYYTKILPYDVKATDPTTNRTNTYTAERCYTAVDGSGSNPIWSSSYYYNGYMPWNSYEVAYWLFGDFWTGTFPGI